MSSPSASHRSALAPLGVLGVAAASLLLAACGGSSPTNAPATERAREQKAETKFADFARCLREHGVNAEAISHPGGTHGLKVSPAQVGPAGVEAAEKACIRYRPEPQTGNPSPQQRVEREEQAQKFAKCMREHGIKVEASANGGTIQIEIHARAGEAGGANPESPSFQKAQHSCQSLLPFKGPGAPTHATHSPGGAGSASSASGG
jgi:hypothetical protein